MKPAKRKTLTPELESTFSRVLERRGYQRFYYHVYSTCLNHRWDHEEALNEVQRQLEEMFGETMVCLISVRDWPDEEIANRKQFRVSFYFRIGPIPTADIRFPVKEQTVTIEDITAPKGLLT